MRRKVKAGLIEADHEECAIVVHYEVEATVLGELGEPIVAERQDNTKRIKLKTLGENTNVPRLAEEIVDKCKLIHESKLPQVEALLHELIAGQTRRQRGRRKSAKPSDGTASEAQAEERPSLDKLEQYVEQMYDGHEAAAHATYMVLQLARSPENLEALLQAEALLGLLSRLLQEEARHSMDLAINVIYILYSFSNFSQFHPVLYQSRVGENVLKVVGMEVKRYALLEHEKKKKKEQQPDAKEDPAEEKRQRGMLRKQEKLLYVCFHVLLNLAEEPDIERKMTKRDIVGYLVSMLKRQNSELLVLVLLFLKKLSVFKENLPALKEKKVVDALAPFVPHTNEALLATTLRLLYNLSFDKGLRDAIVASPMTPRLVALLKKKAHLPLVLRLLYNLSAEPKPRHALCQTDAPLLVRKHVVSCSDVQLPAELAALAINLASDARGGEVMAEGGGVIRQMIDRLYRTHDTLLMKLLRSLALHAAAAAQLLQYAPDLMALAQQVDSAELLVELLGIIGALPLHQIGELPELIQKYSFVEFLARHLVPGFTDDDVLLEVVVIAGALARQPQCAQLLSESRVVTSLYSLITEKQEDDEIVLQILYAFFQLLQADLPRQSLLEHTQIVVYLLDLLLDKSATIRKMADRCLDVVMETDQGWAAQIRQRKFEMHNKEWLDAVDEDEVEEYQDALALNSAMTNLQVGQGSEVCSESYEEHGDSAPRLRQPLDASQLEDEYDDEYGEMHSPTEDSVEATLSRHSYYAKQNEAYSGVMDSTGEGSFRGHLYGDYAIEHDEVEEEEHDAAGYPSAHDLGGGGLGFDVPSFGGQGIYSPRRPSDDGYNRRH